MKRQTVGIFTKEWVELTLCDMSDEILIALKNRQNSDEIIKIIKKYSTEIYNCQK